MMRPSDEQLMAYADGELPAAEAAAIAALAESDPAVARRIHAFAATRALLQQSFAQAEIPQRTLQFLREGAASAPRARRRLPRWLPMALAASFVAGIAIVLLMDTLRGGAGFAPTAAPAALQAALEGTASGVPVERVIDGRSVELLPLATLQTADGRYCREYSLTPLDPGGAAAERALACRDAGGAWQRQSAPAAAHAAEQGDTYRLAGAEPGAAPAGARRLSPDQERAAMASGWR
ncbi:MAG: hypothetical protein WC809_03080 [Sinimarinibacterium sp.]|jgi:hypothetical protein